MNSRQNNALSAFNLRSSVLCPETRQITSQYLALQQLNAHYSMVSHAKGSVDMSAPKSLQSFLSSVSKRTKSNWKECRLLPPESPSRNRPYRIHVTGAHVSHEDYDAGCNENASASVNKSIQTGIPYPQIETNVGDKISWYLEAVRQGEFQRIMVDNHPLQKTGHFSNSSVSLSSSLRSGKIVKGDLMETHKNCFASAQRSFSPRIAANNTTKSKVLGMRCYNPPRRKQKQQNSMNSSDTFESYEEEEEEELQNEFEESEEDHGGDDYEEEEVIEEIKTEASTRNDLENEVQLKSSLSHQDWLREQALRAQMQKKLKANRTKPPLNLAQKLRENLTSHHTNSILPPNENDEKHLKFLSDVTEDILRSGIFTDGAIRRTFDFHLQFCAHEEQEKMKLLLNQILEGLQASVEEDCSDSIKRISLNPSENVQTPKGAKSVQDISDHVLNETAAPSFDEQSNELSVKDGNLEQSETAVKQLEEIGPVS